LLESFAFNNIDRGHLLCMLAGGDATPSNDSQSPRHPEGWCPPDMSDFGTAFDSLKLSTVPSNVQIEHVPHDGQHGQHIEEMLQHAVQENSFADMPAAMGSSVGRAPVQLNHRSYVQDMGSSGCLH